MSSPSQSQRLTHVVELTPQGRGAVAVVLVAGPDATSIVSRCFIANSGRSLVDAPLGRIVVGRWGSPTGEELVVCRRSDEEIEIHCHGGSAAVATIVEALVADRCRKLTWQEWLHGSCSRVSEKLGSKHQHPASSAKPRDAIECGAQIALADAVTARSAAILLDQLNGTLSSAIKNALAAIDAADWQRAADLIRPILGRRELGLHLTAPWRVVFAGPPNVGKSSLINALAGYDRAIVSPIPGTTRDVVTLTTAIEGWPVQLADTAGLRATHDELESAGIDLARAALASADFAILVEDASASSEPDDRFAVLPSRVIRVRNKVDLLSNAPGAPEVEDDLTRPVIQTSALTGYGITQLAAAIGRSLVPVPPARGDAVPFTPQQIDLLIIARDAIECHQEVAARDALQSLLSEPDER